MVMGNDDMNYINPNKATARGNEDSPLGPASRRDYEKHAERVFKLKRDVTVPAGTVFARAPLQRGGVDRTEGIVALGSDATAYLNLPVRVAEIDATEWFEEITGYERLGSPREEIGTEREAADGKTTENT